jgi:hypothetical protein
VLAAALLVLLAVPAGAQGPGSRRPPGSPVVVDAQGREVGAVLGTDLLLLVVTVGLRAGGQVSAVGVLRHQFVGGSGVIGFEASDCTGERFLLEGPSAPFLEAPAAIGPGNVLHGATGEPEPRPIAALWDPAGTPACRPQPPAVTAVFRVVTLLDLDTFQPPFRIE